MDAASLTFASNDNLVLDLSTSSDDISGDLTDVGGTESTGSYLTGSLNTAVHNATGLSLSDLHTMGIDVLDLDGSATTAMLHIDSTDVKAMDAASLTFASNDIIELDVITSEDLLAVQTLLEEGVSLTNSGIDHLQFGTGVTVDLTSALESDQSLADLLNSLTGSSVTSNGDYVGGVTLQSTADISITDAMVNALMDAGLFTADTTSTIEVDATAAAEGHLSTSLAELGAIGADAVVTDTAETYIDLGDSITDAASLSTLLTELDSGKADGFSLVVDEDGHVADSTLLLTSAQSAIADAIKANSDSLQTKLSSIGIDHVYYRDDSGDLIIGLEKYKSIDIT